MRSSCDCAALIQRSQILLQIAVGSAQLSSRVPTSLVRTGVVATTAEIAAQTAAKRTAMLIDCPNLESRIGRRIELKSYSRKGALRK